MPLSEVTLKSLKPKDKAYKKPDSEGLYILVNTKGGMYWRLKYRFQGKENALPLGVYPKVSLKQARVKKRKAKALLEQGIDPAVQKKLDKIQNSNDNSFKQVANEWHTKKCTGQAKHTISNRAAILEKHLFPHIGTRPINEITAPELLAPLRRLESQDKVSTAHRARGIMSNVFRFAIATGRAERDPAADLQGALTPEITAHHPSITDPKKLGQLLRDIDGYTGTLPVKCALQLAPLLFVRPVELRKAEWPEFDLEASQWIIPADKTKMRREHLVPLSQQAVNILSELQKLTGNMQYVFSTTGKPMSNATVNNALKRMGYEHDRVTGHGFRTTASTILHEQGYLSDAIERQLAHVEHNEVKRTYNKALHIKERVKIMQAWSDFLYGLKADKSGKVVQLKHA
jgi:integrase